MTIGHPTEADYVLETAGRLRQAKGDLYAWLLHNGVPFETQPYVARGFLERFSHHSPIRAALLARQPGPGLISQRDALGHLCQAIDRSELLLNEPDHFDNRLVPLLALASRPQPPPLDQKAFTVPMAAAVPESRHPRRRHLHRLLRVAHAGQQILPSSAA